MVAGWAELVQKMQQELQGGGLDPDLLWTEFRDLAARSERADKLEHLVLLGPKLPMGARSTIAVVIADILAPVEWPPDWEAIRWKLVNALDDLLRETNALFIDSFSRVLALETERELDVVGWTVLQSARDLLRTPCRRDELRIVARLCNAGHTSCLTAYRRALKRLGERAADEVIVGARRRYAFAVHKYAQAARELNDVYGTVLFEGLDAPLGGSEA